MLAHRLSGFTGPVPSAALDKQVFSCVRQISYHPAVILSRTDVNFLDTLPEMMEMSRCLSHRLLLRKKDRPVQNARADQNTQDLFSKARNLCGSQGLSIPLRPHRS